jgi:hypothetical protein
MVLEHSSETSVLTRPTWLHIPEDSILHSHCHENLKSYNCNLYPQSPGFRPATTNRELAFEKVNFGQVYLQIIGFLAGNNISTNINYSMISIFDMCVKSHIIQHIHTLSDHN